MQLKFRSEAATRVRFFSSLSALERELKGCAFVWKDAKAPLRVKGRLVRSWPGGEGCKSWSEVERGLEWLAQRGAERRQRIAAVGGGALLDFSAMTASLYRRGMGLVLVPSTLLGMVDASLGGKTAVDRTVGGKLFKNFAGTFYAADEVWIYPGLLSTLPHRERVSGAGEVLKALWLAGKEERLALESFVQKGTLSPGLTRLIRSCLATKIAVVEKDPLDEKRIRECLNYGHTVGHALESLAGGRLSHGEAVLWGMAVESGALGAKGMAMQERALQAAHSFGLRMPGEFHLPGPSWAALFKSDKKNRGGKIEMTVLEAPGRLRKVALSPRELVALVKAFPESCRP